MKKRTAIIALILALALILCSCGGQNKDKGFSYSGPFDDNGYWKNIKASEYVTLPDLDNIEVKQADLDKHIDELLESHKYDAYEGKIGETDSVNIDYVGSVDGVEFEGGSTGGKGTEVNIATTKYIDGFLPQLVGHSPGETFDINVKFPDPYENNPDLAGKDAVFRITVNYIVGKTKGEWNDSFVADKLSQSYGWTTTAEAEADLLDYIVEDYVFDNSKFEKDIPEEMMTYQRGIRVAYYQRFADAYNMSLEDFLKYYLSFDSADALWDSVKGEAETDSKYYLMYQAVAEKLGYSVSEDEIKAYFLEMNGSEDYSSSAEQFGTPYIKFMIMCENVVKKLSANAKLVK